MDPILKLLLDRNLREIQKTSLIKIKMKNYSNTLIQKKKIHIYSIIVPNDQINFNNLKMMHKLYFKFSYDLKKGLGNSIKLIREEFI